MEIASSHRSYAEADVDALIIPVFDGETPREGLLCALNEASHGAVAAAFETGEVDGKAEKWAYLHTTGSLRARRLLLYGAGKAAPPPRGQMQTVASGAARLLGERGLRSAAAVVRNGPDRRETARELVEGCIIGQMRSDLYSSKNHHRSGLDTLFLLAEPGSGCDFEHQIRIGKIMGEATNLARLLGNEPGNVMTPTELAKRANVMAHREGLAFEALSEDEMKVLGMGALLAVSRGSQEPAQLISLAFEPPGGSTDSDLIALIGKGITFDSGGLSIKPAEKMEEMKYDMAGGAAVIGAMQAIARFKPSSRVIGIVPASENLPSGRAVKPGDVVRSLSGKTIEVVNTDAEGRLVLADAISYAINRGASCIVDVATLTGACVIALGEAHAAVMGTDQQLIDDLMVAGNACGERLWPMPLDKDYGELIKSEIADVKNVGNRTAGSITAAYFLKHFVGSASWAHLDIAGTAWTEKEKPYIAKGATGFGARLLANFVMNRARAGASAA